MERFFDDLSKRLAKAVSRREMLNITARALAGTLLSSAGIEKLWSQSSATSASGVGSPICGAVQQAIQLGFPNPSQFTNHGQYVGTIAQATTSAENAGFITTDCAGCIISQFARGLPVSQQQKCGSLVMPTQSCGEGDSTTSQIQTAAVLALAAAPNAFGDPEQFVTWTNLTQEILGCLLAPSPETPSVASADNDASTCAVSGVNYCGPGNSVLPTNPALPLPSVASCINEQCCVHDNCYAKTCEPFSCYFTPQTAACDAPLLAACMGQGCTSAELGSGWTAAVCEVVKCLVLGSAAETAPSALCLTIQTDRLALSPECDTQCEESCCGPGTECMTTTTILPGTLAGICCPSTSSVCGDTCCAAGMFCFNDQCMAQCPSATVACGTTCCSSRQTCSNGQCVTPTCPVNTTPCGTTCCPSTATCVNGQCVPTVCPEPQVNYPCGAKCCSQAAFPLCYATAPTGALNCYPPGSVQCSDLTVFDSPGPGFCCVATPGSGITQYCAEGFVCCNIPGCTWCCAAGEACGGSCQSCFVP